ncbi:MAG: PQQ-dependent sugar dehydrogenase, partial [Planctomycetota bacterium]
VLEAGVARGETLHVDGYFQYGFEDGSSGTDPPPAGDDTITIFAAGNENDETMQLLLAGEVVATFENIGGNAYGGQFQAYRYTSNEAIAIENVRIAFTNDLYLDNGRVDRNLRIDRVEIGSQVYQTEAPDTFGTGTFTGIGFEPGFNESEFLHGDGYFQFKAESNLGDGGTISLLTSNATVDEGGIAELTIVRENGSRGFATVDYATIAGSASNNDDFVGATGTIQFADGETRKVIEIATLDDSLVEGNEQFNVTIDNVNGADLLVPRTATVTILDNEIELPDYVDFASVTGLTFNDDASQLGQSIQLTPNSRTREGSVFYDQAISLAEDGSFRSAFELEIDGGVGGADGMTFTIQNDPRGAAALGSSGGGLGYTGIANSVAVQFDTYRNQAYDPNNNHVSIGVGTVESSQAFRVPDFDLNSGDPFYAWVEYNGNSDVLAVYVSRDSAKPQAAFLKTTIDLESVVGDQAYFGFTAATGGQTNLHKVNSWTLDTQDPPLDPPVSQPIGGDPTAVDIVTGLTRPTAIDWLPSGSALIAQQDGVVRLASNGTLANVPFIDISDQVNGTRDRGLLDIAIHPDFENNPYVYLLFTYDPPEVFDQATGTLAGPDGKGNRAGRLVRVTADATNGFATAVEGSEVVMLGKNSTWDNFNGFANSTFDFTEPPAGENADGTYLQDFINSDSESHTIGGLAFAPDGALFVSIGDGASYNRVDVRAARVQDIDSLSGKVLRIDPITGQGLTDNPFFNGDANANRSKVYQLGLRNPFRISVDQATGQLYVGDVGWSRWEEVNAAGAGANFGWPFYEGQNNGVSAIQERYLNTPEGQAWLQRGETVTAAAYALSHQADGINAIVAGDVYRGSAYGDEYQGSVFFNDLGQGIVRRGTIGSDGLLQDVETFATGANVVVQMSQGPDGLLYFVDLDDGKVGRWELV